jgi:hypothetical protein
MLDQGITAALWGARRPDQLMPVDQVTGWWLDARAMADIDRILRETITDPVGPEFMAPPARSTDRPSRTSERSAPSAPKRRRTATSRDGEAIRRSRSTS